MRSMEGVSISEYPWDLYEPAILVFKSLNTACSAGSSSWAPEIGDVLNFFMVLL